MPGGHDMKSTGTSIRRHSSALRALAPPLRRGLAASGAVFIFWLVISASLAPADLGLGAALSLLLGWWSARFLWARDTPQLSPRQWWALARYLSTLGFEVLLAAIHVARVVADPRLPIAPRVVVCRTRLQRQISRVAFAHSVTLTPGTLTIDMQGSVFLVHCLDEASARRVLSGELERRVASVFEEARVA
jgi:multicomponent Na+:H+ antiporter subunit E